MKVSAKNNSGKLERKPPVLANRDYSSRKRDKFALFVMDFDLLTIFSDFSQAPHKHIIKDKVALLTQLNINIYVQRGTK